MTIVTQAVPPELSDITAALCYAMVSKRTPIFASIAARLIRWCPVFFWTLAEHQQIQGYTLNSGKGTCKPNSVVCGHSSRRRVTARARQRPTRRFRRLLEAPGRIGPMRSAAMPLCGDFPPYLVLLRVGFTLPPALPTERCALTAPFHPYPGTGPGRQLT